VAKKKILAGPLLTSKWLWGPAGPPPSRPRAVFFSHTIYKKKKIKFPKYAYLD